MKYLSLIAIVMVTLLFKCITAKISSQALVEYKNVAHSFFQFSTLLSEVTIKGETENFVISPISTAIILSLATCGAHGNSKEELIDVLHLLPDKQSNMTVGVKALLETLNNSPAINLHTTNKIFLANEFSITQYFQHITKTYYGTTTQNLDFTKSDEAVKEINHWVAEKTNKLIKEIVTKDQFGDDTALVLVNAIYFKGKWQQPFNPNYTELKPFYVDQFTTKQVSTMYKRAIFNYGYLDNLYAEFIEIPYQNSSSGPVVSMFILFPTVNENVNKIEDNLHKLNINDLYDYTFEVDVELFLPRFKIEKKTNLNKVLQKMGLDVIFGDSADFSGISTSYPLKVSDIVQKAFIEVNEEGSTAGAATTIEIDGRMWYDYKKINVNKPFIVLIASRDYLLFTAKITDPSL